MGEGLDTSREANYGDDEWTWERIRAQLADPMGTVEDRVDATGIVGRWLRELQRADEGLVPEAVDQLVELVNDWQTTLASVAARLEAVTAERDRMRAEVREAVTPPVVAVDRWVERSGEADEAVRLCLWRAMTSACTELADAFDVYPLRGSGGDTNPGTDGDER